jgi:thioredoxin reductase (NADPH)
MDEPIKTDVVIIGAGPIGLFAVFELGLLDMKAHVIDILDKIGGQCAELYPEKPIYDIPGIPYTSAHGLVDALLQQIKPFNAQFHLNEMVEKVEKIGDPLFRVTTDQGKVFREQGRRHRRRRRLVPAQASADPRHRAVRRQVGVLRRAQDGSIPRPARSHRRRRRQRARLDAQPRAHRQAPDTPAPAQRIPRRARQRQQDDGAWLARARSISCKAKSPRFKATKVRSARPMVKTGDGSTMELACDVLLPFFGLTMKLGPVANWGFELKNNELIPVDTAAFETSTPGIFAIGDINWYPGKLKLILSGFHEAALMAQKAYHYVYPEKRLVFQYTTSSTSLQKKLGVTPQTPQRA